MAQADQPGPRSQGPQPRAKGTAKKRVTPPPPRSKRGGARRTDLGSRKWLYIATAGIAVAVAVALILTSVLGGKSSTSVSAVDARQVNALLRGIPQDGRVLGSPKAKNTLVVFVDPQCPNCAEFTADALPSIIRSDVRTGKLRVEERAFPFIGSDSVRASWFTYAAALQNRYWNVIELLYQNQGDENSGWVTDDLLRSIGTAVPGLDVSKWFEDAQSASVKNAVQKSYAEGQRLGVPGTPTFGIERPGATQLKPLSVKAYTPEAFQEALAPYLGT